MNNKTNDIVSPFHKIELGIIKNALQLQMMSSSSESLDAEIAMILVKIEGILHSEHNYKTPINEVIAYQDLFDFFYQEHNLHLLHSEIDDIIKAVDKFKNTYDENK